VDLLYAQSFWHLSGVGRRRSLILTISFLVVLAKLLRRELISVKVAFNPGGHDCVD